MTLALLASFSIIIPSVKRNVVVHLKQEWVNGLTISYHLREELLVDFFLQGLVLLLDGYLIDLVLGLQFDDLHLSVQPKVSILAP